VPVIEELIGRPGHPAPVLEIEPFTDFYEVGPEGVKLASYEHGEQVTGIQVAA
jgi:hypothetical protein